MLPKLSKTELEAQLAKLERTVSRLREQNNGLKRLVRDGADIAEAATVATLAHRNPRVAAASKSRRLKSSRPVRHDDPADGAEADAEDHQAAARARV